MKLTDEMETAIKLHPDLVPSCSNCDWHYPPELEYWDGRKVWCVAYHQQKNCSFLCRKWDLDDEICLIQAPSWAEKNPKRRRECITS